MDNASAARKIKRLYGKPKCFFWMVNFYFVSKQQDLIIVLSWNTVVALKHDSSRALDNTL